MAAVDSDPCYDWRAIGDFVVVRPKNAWNDSAYPFNRPARNLRVENAMSNGMLLGLRDFIYTNRLAVIPTQQGIPVSFEVQSGTIIDVLNQLMESSDTVFVERLLSTNAQPGQRFPNWDLKMQLMDAIMMRHLTESLRPRDLK